MVKSKLLSVGVSYQIITTQLIHNLVTAIYQHGKCSRGKEMIFPRSIKNKIKYTFYFPYFDIYYVIIQPPGFHLKYNHFGIYLCAE